MKKYISIVMLFLLNIVYSGAFAQLVVEETAIDTKIKSLDPLGLGITLIGVSVVFLALLAIFIMLNYLSKFIGLRGKIKQTIEEKRAQKNQKNEAPKLEEEMSGEVTAAITLALYLNKEEAHDMFDPILTIKKVNKMYSPWNAKIYNMRQVPSKYNKKN